MFIQCECDLSLYFNEKDPKLKQHIKTSYLVQLEKYNDLSILSQQPVERVSGGGHLKASAN